MGPAAAGSESISGIAGIELKNKGQKPIEELGADIVGHWAEKDIKTLMEKGAITGYPDKTFKPNNSITRAEFASVLVKAFELETKTGKIFSDTAEHWAKDIIATSNAHGIVDGYSDEKFGPVIPLPVNRWL